MTMTKRLRVVLLVLGLALLAAGCGFTSLAVEMTPNPIVVTPDTKDVDLQISLSFNGTGFVTVDEVVLSFRNVNGDVVRNPDTGEDLVWTEAVEHTVPAFGASTTIKHTIELDYETVSELGIDHVHLSIIGSRPTTATSKVILMPQPEE